MKSIFTFLTLAAVLLLNSCEDWTKPESMDFLPLPLSPLEQDPAAYRNYLKSLREYKDGDHKIAMVTIPGISTAPSRQNQQLTSMADSVDFICMKNVAGLHPSLVKQIPKVHEKGTRVVCVVDYNAIDNAWKAMYEEDEETRNNASLFAAYCKEQTDMQLSCCDEYGFDGIEISYLGNTSTEIGERGQEAFMGCVAKWRETHGDRLMFFRGYVNNLTDKSILGDCAYIVILAGNAVSNSEMTLTVQRNTSAGVPTDRFILEVAVPPISDPVQAGATPLTAAEWVNIDYDRFAKSGLAVDNAQDDYFNTVLIYKNIREMIAVMNPRGGRSITE